MFAYSVKTKQQKTNKQTKNSLHSLGDGSEQGRSLGRKTGTVTPQPASRLPSCAFCMAVNPDDRAKGVESRTETSGISQEAHVEAGTMGAFLKCSLSSSRQCPPSPI